MKFLTIKQKGYSQPGVLHPDGHYAVPLKYFGFPAVTLEEFIVSSTSKDLEKIQAELPFCQKGIPLSETEPEAAIPEPMQEVLIMENNFLRNQDEALEFKKRRKTENLLPAYYYKKATRSNFDGGFIPFYTGHVTELDYQAELCVVIWKDVYQCTEAEAKEYIFGYLVINNVIAHNLTKKHRRPYIATSLDGFLPMSSYIMTADEAGYGPFTVRSYVNEELRQDATTELLKFDAAYAIADLSQGAVLRAGTILSLGTPYGRGKDQKPEQYLKPGDTVTCEVAGVGKVTNSVRGMADCVKTSC